MTQRDIISKTLEKLSDHYTHKVMVYALTLLEIQEENKIKSQKD